MFAKHLLASVAGGASGSVLTWMAMDNEHLKAKKAHAAEVNQLHATIKVHEEKIRPFTFGAAATGTIAMLVALTSRHV